MQTAQLGAITVMTLCQEMIGKRSDCYATTSNSLPLSRCQLLARNISATFDNKLCISSGERFAFSAMKEKKRKTAERVRNTNLKSKLPQTRASHHALGTVEVKHKHTYTETEIQVLTSEPVRYILTDKVKLIPPDTRLVWLS